MTAPAGSALSAFCATNWSPPAGRRVDGAFGRPPEVPDSGVGQSYVGAVDVTVVAT